MVDAIGLGGGIGGQDYHAFSPEAGERVGQVRGAANAVDATWNPERFSDLTRS